MKHGDDLEIPRVALLPLTAAVMVVEKASVLIRERIFWKGVLTRVKTTGASGNYGD